MADSQRSMDRLDQERVDEAERRNIPTGGGRGGDLDMGGGGPTGASGPGMPHRSNLDTSAGSPMAGALDDLPDMTGSDGLGTDTDAETATSVTAAGGTGGLPTPSASDTFESTISNADIRQPSGDNANMGRGSDRFNASNAYTGDDGDDTLVDSRSAESSLERNTAGRRTSRDVTGSGDSGTAGEGLGDMAGQGIDSQDFKTSGADN